MPPVSETTNPGLPTLESVPVNERECRQRRERITDSFERQTEKILAVQAQTLSAVNTLGTDLKVHIGRHKEQREGRQAGWKNTASWIGIISLLVTLASLLGMIVWKVAHI